MGGFKNWNHDDDYWSQCLTVLLPANHVKNSQGIGPTQLLLSGHLGTDSKSIITYRIKANTIGKLLTDIAYPPSQQQCAKQSSGTNIVFSELDSIVSTRTYPVSSQMCHRACEGCISALGNSHIFQWPDKFWAPAFGSWKKWQTNETEHCQLQTVHIEFERLSLQPVRKQLQTFFK